MQENDKIVRFLHTFSRGLLREEVAATTSRSSQEALPIYFSRGLLRVVVVAATSRSRRASFLVFFLSSYLSLDFLDSYCFRL